jgi:hypothetical protein
MTESPIAVTCPARKPGAGEGKVLVVVVGGAEEGPGVCVGLFVRLGESRSAARGWDPELSERTSAAAVMPAIVTTPVTTRIRIRVPRDWCRATPGIVAVT